VAVLDGGVTVKNIAALSVERVGVRANQTTTVRGKGVPSHPAGLSAEQRKAHSRDARSF